MEKKKRKSQSRSGRRVAAMVAGVLASTSSDLAAARPDLEAEKEANVVRTPVATPQEIDGAITRLAPGAMRRLLLNLRAEDKTKIAKPAHDTHNSFGSHNSTAS